MMDYGVSIDSLDISNDDIFEIFNVNMIDMGFATPFIDKHSK